MVLETLRDDEPFEVRSREELCGPAPTAAPQGPAPAVAFTF